MLMSGLLALIGLAVVALLLFGLLGAKEPWDLDLGEGVLAGLNRKKGRLLRALKDLENQRENGTLTEEEFHTLRNDFKLRALGVMKELDRVRVARIRHVRGGEGGPTPGLRRKVERLVKERSAKSETSD